MKAIVTWVDGRTKCMSRDVAEWLFFHRRYGRQVLKFAAVPKKA